MLIINLLELGPEVKKIGLGVNDGNILSKKKLAEKRMMRISHHECRKHLEEIDSDGIQEGAFSKLHLGFQQSMRVKCTICEPSLVEGCLQGGHCVHM